MKKTLLLILISILTFSCSSSDDSRDFVSPGPTEEDIRKELRMEISDSLINVYKGSIGNPSKLYDVVTLIDSEKTAIDSEKTVLAGKTTNNNLWVGVFKSPSEKIIENEFPFKREDIESYLIRGSGLTSSFGSIFTRDKEEFFFDAYLVHSDYEDYQLRIPHHRFLFKHNNEDKSLKTVELYFEEGGSSFNKLVRGFEDSYLIATYPEIFVNVTGDILYLDSNFENSEVWVNGWSCFPDRTDTIQFLNKELFFKWSKSSIQGTNMNGCSEWTITVSKDIFDYHDECRPCHSTIELISQSEEELVFEIAFRGDERKVTIDSYTGEIITNEAI